MEILLLPTKGAVKPSFALCFSTSNTFPRNSQRNSSKEEKGVGPENIV